MKYKIGLEYSLEGVMWRIKWFEVDTIETLYDEIHYFIVNMKSLYGKIIIKEKWIYE